MSKIIASNGAIDIVNSNTINANQTVSVGANVIANTTTIRVGNSTTNLVISNNTLYIGNSSANVIANSSGIYDQGYKSPMVKLASGSLSGASSYDFDISNYSTFNFQKYILHFDYMQFQSDTGATFVPGIRVKRASNTSFDSAYNDYGYAFNYGWANSTSGGTVEGGGDSVFDFIEFGFLIDLGDYETGEIHIYNIEDATKMTTFKIFGFVRWESDSTNTQDIYDLTYSGFHRWTVDGIADQFRIYNANDGRTFSFNYNLYGVY